MSHLFPQVFVIAKTVDALFNLIVVFFPPPRREPPTGPRFAPAKIRREEYRAELRGEPASFDRRSNSSLRHPGISWHSHLPAAGRLLAVHLFLFRWEPSARVIVFLS